MSLAGDLGWRGISCMLLEQTDGAILQPKMDGVNVRTMEFCRRWGITGWVRDCGYPKEFPQDMVYLTSFNGYELGREEFVTPSGGSEERLPGASPETRFRCPQNLFDPILRRYASSLEPVKLRYQTQLLDFTEHTDHVVSTVKNPATGECAEVTSRYLIGCDGAASTVRKKLGIGMSGLGTLTYTTNILFTCPELRGCHRIRLGYRHIFIGPEGTWATVVAIDGRDEWRLSIIGGKERKDLTEADVRAAIERVIGMPVKYEIKTIVPWVRRELVADSYGARRVFLAGDAAHVTSPTGGFGMNMGIADSIDLSWKIEAMLAGWSGAGLLESYEVERRPVAQRAVREASGNLLRTLSPGANPRLLEQSYEGALLRYSVGARFSATMLREWYKLGIDLGYIYRSGTVISDEPQVPAGHEHGSLPKKSEPQLQPPGGYLENGDRVTPSMLREWQRLSMHLSLGQDVKPDWQELPAHEVMLYRQTSQPGARAPHAWLSDWVSTLDWFGRGFVLVNSGDEDTSAIERAASSRGMPLTVQRCDLPDVKKLYAAPLVLVRPDGHVAWRGGAPASAKALEIIDRVRGAG